MRIISGNFKGKKILLPKDKLTRPLKDLTKESIFNIIQHSKLLDINLENSKILDLFSGVGSFGIECLSRGAKKVIFVENYTGVLPVLKKNLDREITDKKLDYIQQGQPYIPPTLKIVPTTITSFVFFSRFLSLTHNVPRLAASGGILKLCSKDIKEHGVAGLYGGTYVS